MPLSELVFVWVGFLAELLYPSSFWLLLLSRPGCCARFLWLKIVNSGELFVPIVMTCSCSSEVIMFMVISFTFHISSHSSYPLPWLILRGLLRLLVFCGKQSFFIVSHLTLLLLQDHRWTKRHSTYRKYASPDSLPGSDILL